MKKIILSVIIASLVFSLCACGGTTSTPTPAPNVPSGSTSTYQGGSTYTWPASQMGNMPNPGKTMYTMASDSTGISCDYLNFPEEEVREYITKVQEAGFVYEEPGSQALAQINELQSGGFMFMAFNEAGETARVIYTNTKYTVITYRPADAGTGTGAVDETVVITSSPDNQ